jgi:hypothetical protein
VPVPKVDKDQVHSVTGVRILFPRPGYAARRGDWVTPKDKIDKARRVREAARGFGENVAAIMTELAEQLEAEAAAESVLVEARQEPPLRAG